MAQVEKVLPVRPLPKIGLTGSTFRPASLNGWPKSMDRLGHWPNELA